MRDFQKNLVQAKTIIRDALGKINTISKEYPSEPLALFVVNDNSRLIGTLTDGDIRRGIVNGNSISDTVCEVMNTDFHFIRKDSFDLDEIEVFRSNNINLIPVLDENDQIEKIYDLSKKKSLLPVDAFIMAGGEGKRLRPLTEDTPKPLLEIGDKPIIEYNIDHIKQYGIDDLVISVNYLAEQLTSYFGDGSSKELNIRYIHEEKPLGTMGAVRLANDFSHDHILMMNSDLLTTVDLESFYKDFIAKEADMAVATIPYEVKLPYAVLDVNGTSIKSLKEKPEYTYYSNGGIYLFKKELVDRIPPNEYYDVTSFMEELLEAGKKVTYFPILGYWLDIGRPEDYEKAQKDIKILEL